MFRHGPFKAYASGSCANNCASSAVKPASGKTKRQAQGVPRKDSHFRLAAVCYQWLEDLAEQYGTSKAKVLDAILRRKPEPDDFYLR